MCQVDRLTASRVATPGPVRLEFVVRPPLGAGPSPGSGRSNGHCSARHGPPCFRQRRSTACGPSTTRRCVPRWRRPDATQRCLDPGFSERIGNSRRTGGFSRSRNQLPRPSREALLHESSRARTMPTDRILTGRCDTTLVGRGRSSDSGSHSRGRPHSPARLDSGREGHRR